MTCTAPPQSLPKSFVETRERQTIIQHGVPFMVKLLCYYASEDSIFLHLEHVQGERSAASLALMQQLRPRGLGLPYLLAQPFSEGTDYVELTGCVELTIQEEVIGPGRDYREKIGHNGMVWVLGGNSCF